MNMCLPIINRRRAGTYFLAKYDLTCCVIIKNFVRCKPVIVSDAQKDREKEDYIQ